MNCPEIPVLYNDWVAQMYLLNTTGSKEVDLGYDVYFGLIGQRKSGSMQAFLRPMRPKWRSNVSYTYILYLSEEHWLISLTNRLNIWFLSDSEGNCAWK